MATLRELKGRIGSVASSEKITGAMKMISSAKMHKAELSLKRLLPFRSQIESIIGNLLTADADFTSPLTETREVRNVSIVVFGSDDGLCGAYNVNIFKQLRARMAALREKFGSDITFDIYPVGAKMVKIVGKMKDASLRTVRVEPQVDSKTTGDGVKIFCEKLQRRFLASETDRVELLYMKFLSAGRQRPQSDALLPVTEDTFRGADVKEQCRPYIFEPDANTIFRPMFLMAVTQEVFTENRASEQAARVMAMQSANDNAKKLLEQLRLEYNKLRQQSITTELLDILGGQVR